MKRISVAAIATAAAIVAVLWFYRWTVANVGGLGPPSAQPADNDYYNLLVRGFTQGHLRMDAPVSKHLMALPDPYDPAQNEPHRMTDASYYQGHYYLYFGAAPAATLLLPYRLLTGKYLPTPTAILIFCSLGFLAATAVWLAARARYFAELPGWIDPLGVAVIGIGSTAGVLLRRPFFWELATAGGFAFSMLAAFGVYGAIHWTRRATWMALAGLSLGLAVASRPTFLFATPVLLLPLWLARQEEGPRRSWRRLALGGALPLAAVGVAVLGYNYGRFGNAFETGHNYLLSVAYESKVRLFSLEHLWFNLRMYFVRAGAWSWHPPFFAPIPVPRAEMPAGFYTVDDPYGLLNVFPAALLALAAPAAARCRRGAERGQIRALLLGLAWLWLSSAGVILLYVATIPRYAVDFFPALMLLATIGMAAVVQRLDGGLARGAARTAVVVAVVFSVVGGSLTYFDAGRLLQRANPPLAAKIDRLTSRIESAIDRARGVHFGPIELVVNFPAQPAQRIETLLRCPGPGETEAVLVEYAGQGQLRFGFAQRGAKTRWSGVMTYDPAASHRVGVELGAFYPALEHRVFATATLDQATALQHRIAVSFDGRDSLQTFGTFVASRRGAPRASTAEFSGQVLTFAARAPNFPAPRPNPAVGAGTAAGGILHLRLVLPPGVKTAWLPILQTGHPGAADTLSLYYMGAEVVQFRFDHWGAPMQVGRSVPAEEKAEHDLEVFLPSFNRDHFGKADSGEMWVRWDGQEVLRGPAQTFSFSPDEFFLGENRAGAMTDDPKFRGYFVTREWLPAP